MPSAGRQFAAPHGVPRLDNLAPISSRAQQVRAPFVGGLVGWSPMSVGGGRRGDGVGRRLRGAPRPLTPGRPPPPPPPTPTTPPPTPTPTHPNTTNKKLLAILIP